MGVVSHRHRCFGQQTKLPRRPLFPIAQKITEWFRIRVWAGEEVHVVGHDHRAADNPTVEARRVVKGSDQDSGGFGIGEEGAALCGTTRKKVDGIAEPDIAETMKVFAVGKRR